MLLLLPSHGLFGQKIASIEIPTFETLKYIQSYNEDQLLRTIKFVELNSNVKLDKVTYFDVKYVFDILAFSLLYNQAELTVTCDECKTSFKTAVNLQELSVVELNLKKLKSFSKGKVKYHLLTAKQEQDLYLQSLYSDNSDEEFLDLKVKAILDRDDLKISYNTYLSALAFEKFFYHGLNLICKANCPSCGRDVNFRLNLTTDLLQFDIAKLLDSFVGLSETMGYKEFLHLTIPDYNLIVASLNRRYNELNK